MVAFESTKQHIDTWAISGAVHSPGLVALIVAQADTTERRWPDAPDAATLMRRAGARVVYYTADDTFRGRFSRSSLDSRSSPPRTWS